MNLNSSVGNAAKYYVNTSTGACSWNHPSWDHLEGVSTDDWVITQTVLAKSPKTWNDQICYSYTSYNLSLMIKIQNPDLISS